MELIESGAEFAKALSDLPIGIICIPFIIILRGEKFKNGKRQRLWSMTFVILMLAAFAGAFAHAFVMSDMGLKAFWAALYLLMFLAVCCFYVLVHEIFKGERMSSRHRAILIGVTAVMYLAAAGARLVTGHNMIAVFAVFALAVVVQLGILMIRTKGALREMRLLKASMVILTAGLLSQSAAFAFPRFNGAAAAHICILAALFAIFLAAEEDCGKI